MLQLQLPKILPLQTLSTLILKVPLSIVLFFSCNITAFVGYLQTLTVVKIKSVIV